jgi:hypothetical protein
VGSNLRFVASAAIIVSELGRGRVMGLPVVGWVLRSVRASIVVIGLLGLGLLSPRSVSGVGSACAAVSKGLGSASAPLTTIYSFSGVRFNWQPQGTTSTTTSTGGRALLAAWVRGT